jgi:hypothetical protein
VRPYDWTRKWSKINEKTRWLGLEAQNQVRMPGKAMLTVGCAPFSAWRLALQAHLGHQTPHSLAVDHQLLVSPQLDSDPAIAVTRPLAGDLLDGILAVALV